MRLTGIAAEPELAFLPWHVPLAEWSDDLVVALPRGISRHVVRFVRVNGVAYAVKEIPEPIAFREYRMLGALQRRDVPSVVPIAVVADRADASGEPLDAALITRHLEFSLPFRALFSSNLRPDSAERLLDALTALLVRLHLIGFSWNDCSLSNTLFRRDAGSFAAYLVDAETGELHPQLSDGQRAYDLDTASTNTIGELMDLQAGGRLAEDMDPIDTGMSLVTRYDNLWREVTSPVEITRGNRYELEGLMRRLNDLGFDVAELQVEDAGGSANVIVRPQVVEAGFHSRRLMNLTGLDVEENQARRLLHDVDSYRIRLGLSEQDEEHAAHRWVTERFERVMAQIPRELRGKLMAAEIFHEVLEHRWFLSERAGRSVSFDVAIKDYVADVLARKPDEQAVLGTLPYTGAEETAALRIVLPPEPRGKD